MAKQHKGLTKKLVELMMFNFNNYAINACVRPPSSKVYGRFFFFFFFFCHGPRVSASLVRLISDLCISHCGTMRINPMSGLAGFEHEDRPIYPWVMVVFKLLILRGFKLKTDWLFWNRLLWTFSLRSNLRWALLLD